uniref:NADH-ubiquinone oxidoreductase chain 4 n=2 Tax=Ledra TaxID=1310350 RepID=A0A6B9QEZ2_9HEMI|nr:NADH dehydrogenase subunit 4 [Ledra auditura]UGK73316.1 NADH dehydrogenase subunit 4 [Ledra trigona]
MQMFTMMIQMKMSKKIIQLSLSILMLKMMMMSTNEFFSSISMGMGNDKLSQMMMLLTVIISNLMTLTMKEKFVIFLNSTMLTILSIMFMSMKMISFYIMFELSLIPMIIMILGWGYQPERMIAGLYLLFYTMTASLPLLLSIMFIYNQLNSEMFTIKYENKTMNLMNMSINIAFLVKMPMFMLHFWLPSAHVQAPIFGSMILAGILLKIGGFGIMRFSTILENSFLSMSTIWYSLSISGTIIISLICMMQGDMKSLIAYSSISHMSMCLMSMLTMTKTGFSGGLLMMIAHGLCSSGMFCLSNMSYERTLSRSMFINKGMMSFMPSNTKMWFLISCLNMGCPPSINFFSEITIMMSMMSFWKTSFLFMIFISLIVSYYSFFLFSYTQHGQHSTNYAFSNNNIKEMNLMTYHIYPMIMMSMIM